MHAEMGSSTYRTSRLGILGGGQLGRMLIQEAMDWNVHVSVLDPDPDAPCSRIADRFVQGSFADYETVLAFGRQVDILTIEIEHVNVDALETLEKEGKTVRPSSRIIRLIQDKGKQKVFYRTHAIPTAEFHLVESAASLPDHAGFLPCMQKLRKGGYDGKGVTPLRTVSDFSQAFDAPSVLEKMIDFDKEVAVIVARDQAGNCSTFPMVEMQFNPEANLVELLFAPARVNATVEKQGAEIAKKIAESLELVGILAIEFFLTHDGQLLVNEMAPRAHNSGHATIEGNLTSQYGQLLRTLIDLPLGDTSMILPSVMINLLGEKDHRGEAVYTGLNQALALPGVFVHLYGKRKTQPFRKMGHVTVVHESLEEAIRIAKQVSQTLKVIS